MIKKSKNTLTWQRDLVKTRDNQGERNYQKRGRPVRTRQSPKKRYRKTRLETRPRFTPTVIQIPNQGKRNKGGGLKKRGKVAELGEERNAHPLSKGVVYR